MKLVDKNLVRFYSLSNETLEHLVNFVPSIITCGNVTYIPFDQWMDLDFDVQDLVIWDEKEEI